MPTNTPMFQDFGNFPLQLLPDLKSPPKTLTIISTTLAEVEHDPKLSFVIGLHPLFLSMGFEVSINGGKFEKPLNIDLDSNYLVSLHGQKLLFTSFECFTFLLLRTMRVRVYTGDVYTLKVKHNGTKVQVTNKPEPKLVFA